MKRWKWALVAGLALLIGESMQASDVQTVFSLLRGRMFSLNLGMLEAKTDAPVAYAASVTYDEPASTPAPTQAQSGGQGEKFASAAAGAHPLAPGQQLLDPSTYLPANPLPAGVRFYSFHTLSAFTYEGDFLPWTDPFSDPKPNRHPKRKIPASIMALDGKRIAAVGFMLPFDFTRDTTRVFGLLRNQAGCCFGQAPALNEWIQVDMGKRPVPVAMDTPLLVWGILHVKRITEAGNTMGVYSMSGERVEPAQIPELIHIHGQ